MIDGCSESYCFDRNSNRCGILIYFQEDILNKLLADHTSQHDIEGVFVEINLRKKKWLLFGLYHTPSRSDE